MKASVKVSVIIPTYNRKGYLYDTLESLANQNWPSNLFEVIVVDDGSTDGTKEIVEHTFPFDLKYVYQPNRGDAIARNTGVKQSKADVLVFLDDDMLVDPSYLTNLLKEHQSTEHRIVVGTEHLWLKDTNPLTDPHHPPLEANNNQPVVEHFFTFVFSRNMSIRRESYFEVGMMDNLGFSGSSIWCDVDFAYRAHTKGYQFLRTTQAICYHRDHVASDLVSTKKRNWEAGYRAVVLFQKYPDLLPYLPMFRDKTPIIPKQDSPKLIIRKIARQLASSDLILWGMEKFVNSFQQYNKTSFLIRPFYRWINGAYIYRGFRDGLRDFDPIVVSELG